MWCARNGHTHVPGRGDNSKGRSVHGWSVRGRVGSPGRTTSTCRACVARSSGTAVPRQPGRRPAPGRRSARRDAGGRGRDPCIGCTQCRCLHGRPADPPAGNARRSCDASANNSGHKYSRRPGGTAGLFEPRTGGSAFVARQDVRRPGHREGRADGPVASPEVNASGWAWRYCTRPAACAGNSFNAAIWVVSNSGLASGSRGASIAAMSAGLCAAV
jgi:hypothetical protein